MTADAPRPGRARGLLPGALLLALLLAAGAASCGGEDPPSAAPPPARCQTCGMRVEPGSGWRAGGRGAGGAELRFDSPKCMFRHAHEAGPLTAPWVIEYYSQERRGARGLRYVLGSDLSGPMGPDLVPVEGEEAAERFRADHHADRVLSFDEVTAPVVDALFHPR